MIEIEVPGKVFLSGEYAVLAGAPAIVLAVDRHLIGRANPAVKASIRAMGSVVSRSPGGTWQPSALPFATAAYEVASAYLGNAPDLELDLMDGELRTPGGHKLGLGGSAATVVAITRLLLGPKANADLVFRLAATAHALAQEGEGSGADVAACSYGGAIEYRRTSPPLPLGEGRGEGLSAFPPSLFRAAIDSAPSPDVQFLPSPAEVLLSYSGSSAETKGLVSRVSAWASAHPREFAEFVARSAAATEGVRDALSAGDVARLGRAIQASGELLIGLSVKSGLPIVIDAHRRIIAVARSAGAAGRVAGAGGGDMCVVVGASESLARAEKQLVGEGFFTMRAGIAAPAARNASE
jgi:phosphomevalonate kinase